LSFNGNKIITTGGGGAILTDSENLYIRAKHLTTTAKQSHPWEYFHNEIGFNYRMPNINAALGCAQLEDIEIKVKRKRELFESYKSAFASIPGVTLFEEPKNSRSNYWLNTLILDSEHASMRDEVLKVTHNLGIGTRPAWQLLSSLPMYIDSPRADLTTAEELQRRVINIPSSAFSLESSE
jgi:perosamine synthetase